MSHSGSKEIEKGLEYSIREGAFAGLMGTLTGGIYLTGFALLLGADDMQIGLLASIPLATRLVLIHASYLIERKGERKPLLLQSARVGRSLWLLIALLPFLTFGVMQNNRVWVFLALFGCYNFFGAISGLTWLSWLSDLVPEKFRGRYFAKRNAITSGLAMLVGVGAGEFLDTWKRLQPSRVAVGFAALFVIAVTCGWVSIFLLTKIPEPPMKRAGEKEPFLKLLPLPFKDRNFRELILFRMAWDLAYGVAGPFFGVYMLKKMALSYLSISILATIGSLASLLSMRPWGVLIDKFGNKPLLAINMVGKSIFPWLWLFTSPHTYWLLVVIHLTSVFDAGLELASSNMLLKLAPKERNWVYLAVYQISTGLLAAVAPIVGGTLAAALEGTRLSFGFFSLEHLKFVFLLSGLLRFSTLFMLKRVSEAEAKSMSEVVEYLGRLNPLEGFQQVLYYFLLPVRWMESRRNRSDESEA